MNTVLSIRQLSKSYGKIKALTGLDLEVREGQVFGILGPNGSGKTTTLSVILQLLNSDTGSFRWFNEIPGPETRKQIGSVIESPNFYPYLTAVHNLQIIAKIKEIGYDDIDHVLTLTGLYERRNSRFKTFSFGMKQRLAIASALLGKPRVLILDEPTNGLDPQGIADIRELIRMVGNEGTTIILASHLLDEVQKVCTHVAVLKQGVKLFDGPVSDVLSKSDCFEISCRNMDALEGCIRQHPSFLSIKLAGDHFEVNFKDLVKPEELNEFCFTRGLTLSYLVERKRTLEQHFLELLEDNA